jgi:putative sugar O-methyltransferase
MQPKSYDDIRTFIDSALRRRREAAERPHVEPSDYWEHFAEHFAYVLRLGDEELGRIRFHGYHLTADIYQKYLFNEPAISTRLRADYDSLARELGGFRPDEGDTPYGCNIDGHWVSTDLLRYMQVVADLVQAGLLSRDRPHQILEIGGGYGGLAAVCMAYNPRISYALCDLEETMFFQAVHLANRFGLASLELCESELPSGEALSPGRFYLLPQNRAGSLTSAAVELVVNQQSFQEMTREQVQAYCALIRKAARYLYSCNADEHQESVASRMGIVRGLGRLLDEEFPRIRWETHPPQGLEKLRERLRGRRRRTGDRKIRRVVYEI